MTPEIAPIGVPEEGSHWFWCATSKQPTYDGGYPSDEVLDALDGRMRAIEAEMLEQYEADIALERADYDSEEVSFNIHVRDWLDYGDAAWLAQKVAAKLQAQRLYVVGENDRSFAVALY